MPVGLKAVFSGKQSKSRDESIMLSMWKMITQWNSSFVPWTQVPLYSLYFTSNTTIMLSLSLSLINDQQQQKSNKQFPNNIWFRQENACHTTNEKNKQQKQSDLPPMGFRESELCYQNNPNYQ